MKVIAIDLPGRRPQKYTGRIVALDHVYKQNIEA
jgi:hypothetical protein